MAKKRKTAKRLWLGFELIMEYSGRKIMVAHLVASTNKPVKPAKDWSAYASSQYIRADCPLGAAVLANQDIVDPKPGDVFEILPGKARETT